MPSATPMRGAATPCAFTASMPSCSTATASRAMTAISRFRERALPDPGRAAAAPRRHRAPRRRGLGLCARRRRAAASISSRTARYRLRHRQRQRGRRRDHARLHRRKEGRRWRLPAAPRVSPPWRACGCRSRAMCCRPSSPKASSRSIARRHHLRRRTLLHQSVGQGRPCLRRRHRRLQFLRAARQPSRRSRTSAKAAMALMPMIGRLRRAAPLGRHHGHVHGRIADHRPHADRRPLPQCRLVLRRLQGDAGLRLVLRPSDRARRAASGCAPPIRLDRFAPAMSSTRRASARNRTCTEASMRIPCPYCGARDAEEFAYLGDATPCGPIPPRGRAHGSVHDYVYLRENPAGRASRVLVSRRGLPTAGWWSSATPRPMRSLRCDLRRARGAGP